MEVTDKFLDPRPARALTSREISKLFGGLMGSLYEFCEHEEIYAALKFLVYNEDTYRELGKFIKKNAPKAKGESDA